MYTKTPSPRSRGASSSSFGRSARSTSSSGTFRYDDRPSRSGGSSAGNFNRKPSFGRGGPSRGGKSFGGGRSTGGRRGFKGDFIDENKYINKATSKTEEVYVPQHTFGDFEIHPKLAENLLIKGFIHPSPIQDQSIPVALTGRDIIGIAQTGTGKTAAFLIPIINKLVADKNHAALVLAPTRELAQQIEDEFKLFTKGMKLYSVSCVGGSPIGRQISELSRGVHIVIGTPGRVKDLIARNKLDMKYCGSVVLDEADRMLDMGFVDDMKYILGLMPKEKQGFFFSATFSPDIKKLCHDFLRDPISITIKSRDTASSVEQDVVRFTDQKDKIEKLHEVLIKPEASKVLIFREMKRSVDELAHELKTRGFKALALHGDMRNRERDRAVKALASGDAHIVIATDVAARGIDIADITHVINYDLPSTYDTYVHRIGRTGRGTKTGNSLTFVQSRR